MVSQHSFSTANENEWTIICPNEISYPQCRIESFTKRHWDYSEISFMMVLNTLAISLEAANVLTIR